MIDPLDPKAASSNGQPTLKDRVKELQLAGRLDGPKSAKGGSTTAWLPWMLCILMALVWAGWGLRYYKTSTNGGSGAPGPTEGTAKAKASESQSKDIAADELVLEAKGYLIPSHSIPISPIDVAGRVIELYIDEGMTFRKGQILAIIDSTRFTADVDEAIAQVAAAKARYLESKESWEYEKQQAEAELGEAKAQFAKDDLEYQTAQSTTSGAVAKLELGQLKKKLDASKEHVKVMEVKNESMKGTPRAQRIEATLRDWRACDARLRKAQWSLDNCTIRAPVTGVILTKKAEKDSLINPVVGGVSTSLCEIADLRMIEVDLEIQERDIAKITVGMVCNVRPDAYADRIYRGYVDRMMPIANRARGIIPVRVKVILPPEEQQGRYLKPEMGVAVSFINAPFPLIEKMLPDVWRGVQEGAVLPAQSAPMPEKQ